jgi:hypothetical protein
VAEKRPQTTLIISAQKKQKTATAKEKYQQFQTIHKVLGC